MFSAPMISFFMISIHAPARGATMFSAPMISFFMISIHAPARGATTIPKIQLLTERHFNPRSREGSDYYSENPASDGTTFQSTLPRGERRNSNPVITSRHNFNPRSREGSDNVCSFLYILHNISIHAPARGATSTYQLMLLCSFISIHAPARGATRKCMKR